MVCLTIILSFVVIQNQESKHLCKCLPKGRTLYKLRIQKCQQLVLSLPLHGVTDGDGKLGVDAVGELSFSSLRLRLFL